MAIKSLRELLFGKDQRLNESEALTIAQQACQEAGLKWLEPVNAKYHRGIYSFWTNFGVRGNNFWVKIDAYNGNIISKGLTTM